VNIAKGEWIAFLDDDDYWFPSKLEKQLDLLKSDPNMKFSSANMIQGRNIFDINNIHLYRLYHTMELPSIFTKKLLLSCNFINNSTVLVHKSIIEKVGEFKIGNYEDYDYWLRCLDYTDCHYISEPLVYYMMNDNKNYIYT
jgi:glycosyltransferase involved in cell wall biosynthesis